MTSDSIWGTGKSELAYLWDYVLEQVLELHLIPRLKKNAKNFWSNEETASGNNIGGEGV